MAGGNPTWQAWERVARLGRQAASARAAHTSCLSSCSRAGWRPKQGPPEFSATVISSSPKMSRSVCTPSPSDTISEMTNSSRSRKVCRPTSVHAQHTRQSHSSSHVVLALAMLCYVLLPSKGWETQEHRAKLQPGCPGLLTCLQTIQSSKPQQTCAPAAHSAKSNLNTIISVLWMGQ